MATYTLNIDVAVSGNPPTYSFALGAGSSSVFENNTALFDPNTGNIDVSTLTGDVDIKWALTGNAPSFNPIPSPPAGGLPPGIQFSDPQAPQRAPDGRSISMYVRNGQPMARKYTLNDNPDQDDPTIKNR